jgi:predicted SpoU family rRNA methylase
MKKIYTDTSVIGGCFDIEFRQHSLALMESFKKGMTKAIISDLTMLELAPVKQEIKNKITATQGTAVIQARSNEKVYALADAYIKSGVLDTKNYHDALHIALATVFKADLLASWQLNYVTGKEKNAILNAINRLMDYKDINILTPTLILKIITDETGKKI